MSSTKPNFADFPDPLYPMVQVIWIDSIFHMTGWVPDIRVTRDAERLGNVPHDTVGHLLKMDAERGHVTIALNSRRDGYVAQAMTIPLIAVHEIINLKTNKKLWPK
jgi:hypothetical protein